MPKFFSGRKLSKFWSNLPVTRQGAIVIAIPTICLGITLGAWIWSRDSERRAYYWIDRTQQVIYQSDRLLRVLVEAETGIRGYYITRDSQFLEPYQQAVKQLPASLEQLEQFVQRPELQEKLQEIELLVQRRMELLVEILEMAKIEEQTASQQPKFRNLFERSKNTMDAVRVSVNDFQNQQRNLLARRTQSFNNVRNRTFTSTASIYQFD